MRDTAISTQPGTGRGRFYNLLSGLGSDCDQVILETNDCVVAPTLGSIIPNWLLVVPHHAAVNFREWRSATGSSPDALLRAVLEKLDVRPGQAIWFEHGPSAAGSLLGCGVDHAHLHILIDPPFSFDEFVSVAIDASRIEWRAAPASAAYDAILPDASYLIAGTSGEAVIGENVDSIGSQFFRRVVANLAGKAEQWDYKIHAHLENVRYTLAAFGQHASFQSL